MLKIQFISTTLLYFLSSSKKNIVISCLDWKWKVLFIIWSFTLLLSLLHIICWVFDRYLDEPNWFLKLFSSSFQTFVAIFITTSFGHVWFLVRRIHYFVDNWWSICSSPYSYYLSWWIDIHSKLIIVLAHVTLLSILQQSVWCRFHI